MTVACLLGEPSCASPAGPDYDFGSGPTLFTANVNGKQQDILGAGQKSGQYWAFDPSTGRVLWETQVGPGGVLGGIEWGSATDGQHIYAAITNTYHTPYTFQSGQVVTGGFWSALDAATGQIVWQTANPTGATASGPMTLANGVVYAGSMDATGTMYAMDAATGQILWRFASGGSVNSGAAIVRGVVYWGSGYARLGLGTGNNTFYAFSVGGK